MNDLAHPVLDDILNQPQGLASALRYQTQSGSAAIQQAAQAVRSAQRVVVVAIGASYSASLPFIYRLASAGRQVKLEDAAEFQHYTYAAYTGPTVYLLISRSGRTVEITNVLTLLKERRQLTIGITNEADSPLALESDLPLLLGSPRDHLIAIQTYQATLLALHLLADAVLGQATDLKDLPDQMAAVIMRYHELSQEWQAQMRPYQGVYLLARGASLASAYQGSLLFHEMARFPGIAYSAGHFRHGPWEVVDHQIRCLVFAPADNTYTLNIALAQKLASLGGETTLITCQPIRDLPTDIDAWPIPHTTASTAPFYEILPVQLFVFHLAIWRGHQPGVFRISTPVTLSEA